MVDVPAEILTGAPVEYKFITSEPTLWGISFVAEGWALNYTVRTLCCADRLMLSAPKVLRQTQTRK